MKNIFSVFVFFIFFALLLPMTDGNVIAESQYDYSVVEISPGARLKPGESVILWVKLQNIGSLSWQGSHSDIQSDGYLHLGTIRDSDRNSDFFTAGNWLSSNRVHMMDQKEVLLGEMGSFGFYVTAPYYLAKGNYRECFAPVVEGVTWMADKGICWDIVVEGNATENIYAAEVVGESDTNLENLSFGTERQVEIKVKNVGSAVWYRDGENPVHLGTMSYHDRDFTGQLYHDSWLTKNRAAGLSEEMVSPGQIGTFKVQVKVPEDVHQYTDLFWLVAENKTWFEGFESNKESKYVQIRVFAVPFDDDFSTLVIDNENLMVGEDLSLTVTLRGSDNQPIGDKVVNLYGGGCRTIGVGCRYFDDEAIVTDDQGLAKYAGVIDEAAELMIGYRVDGYYSIDTIKNAVKEEGQQDIDENYLKISYRLSGSTLNEADSPDQYNKILKSTTEEIAKQSISKQMGLYYRLDRDILDVKSRIDWYEFVLSEPVKISYKVFDQGLYKIDGSRFEEVEEVLVDKILVVIVDGTGEVYFVRSDQDDEYYQYSEYIGQLHIDLSQIEPLLVNNVG